MTIAIDLNDVLRDFTMNFAKYYQRGYNHEFDYDELELWTNDPAVLFPFKSDNAFRKFAYEDFAYELYGACPTCEQRLSAIFEEWVTKTVANIDVDEPIDLIMVSPFEYGLSISSTMFFLSKIACRVRKVFMPVDSSEIWDKCDVLITANPQLLETKPEGKKTIKISKEYNVDNSADYTYLSFRAFAENPGITESIVKDFIKEKVQ